MDLKSIFARVKGIIVAPVNEWVAIVNEEKSQKKLLLGYLLPLALVAAVATFIGYTLVGEDNPLGRIIGPMWGLKYAILELVNLVLGAYLCAFIVAFFAPGFGAVKNFGKAFSLVVYSYTPMLAAGILNIFPFLGFVTLLAGIYSLYILYIGLKPMIGVPNEKTTTFFIIVLVAAVVINSVVPMVFMKLFF